MGYVITAAHCMFFDQDATSPLTTSDVTVRIGDHNLAATGETSIPEKTVAVSAIYNHENYKPATGSLNNDITVLELAEEVDINVYTPACLAHTSDTTTFDGKIAQVYGWGTTSSGGSSSSTLLEVSLPVVTNTQCATSMGLKMGRFVQEEKLERIPVRETVVVLFHTRAMDNISSLEMSATEMDALWLDFMESMEEFPSIEVGSNQRCPIPDSVRMEAQMLVLNQDDFKNKNMYMY